MLFACLSQQTRQLKTLEKCSTNKKFMPKVVEANTLAERESSHKTSLISCYASPIAVSCFHTSDIVLHANTEYKAKSVENFRGFRLKRKQARPA